jgi:hypothetical protein
MAHRGRGWAGDRCPLRFCLRYGTDSELCSGPSGLGVLRRSGRSGATPLRGVTRLSAGGRLDGAGRGPVRIHHRGAGLAGARVSRRAPRLLHNLAADRAEAGPGQGRRTGTHRSTPPGRALGTGDQQGLGDGGDAAEPDRGRGGGGRGGLRSALAAPAPSAWAAAPPGHAGGQDPQRRRAARQRGDSGRGVAAGHLGPGRPRPARARGRGRVSGHPVDRGDRFDPVAARAQADRPPPRLPRRRPGRRSGCRPVRRTLPHYPRRPR